jgi:hypothetical protein
MALAFQATAMCPHGNELAKYAFHDQIGLTMRFVCRERQELSVAINTGKRAEDQRFSNHTFALPASSLCCQSHYCRNPPSVLHRLTYWLEPSKVYNNWNIAVLQIRLHALLRTPPCTTILFLPVICATRVKSKGMGGCCKNCRILSHPSKDCEPPHRWANQYRRPVGQKYHFRATAWLASRTLICVSI